MSIAARVRLFGMAATLSAGATLIGAYASLTVNAQRVRNEAAVSDAQSALLQEKLATLSRNNEELRKRIQSASKPVQNSKLADRVDALERSQQRLEKAISDDPERALSLPLLRRDLEHEKEQLAAQGASLKTSIDQLYDLTKWLFGGLAALIVGSALTQFFTRDKRDNGG